MDDPEGIKDRSRWLSESASDTTGSLKKSLCIPEGCQRAATPAGVGSLGENEPVVSACWPQPPATGWQASGLLERGFADVSGLSGCQEYKRQTWHARIQWLLLVASLRYATRTTSCPG